MHANVRAAMMMMAAKMLFTVNDAITKWVASGIGVGQTMLLRGLLATLILAVLARSQGAFERPAELARPAVVLRSLCEVGGTVTFLAGLAHLPLSLVSAIYQALPLVVTLGAALFLGEAVGWRRWTAIIVGFLGVMLIVQPGGGGFSVWSVVIVASVFFSAARDLFTRRIPRDMPTFGVAMLASIGVTACGALMIPLEGGLKPVSAGQWTGIAATAVLIASAYITLISAMRSGDVSFIAPFRYSALLIAILIGYFAFGETPDAAMLAGAAIVIGSGIYMFHRERVRARDASGG